MKIQLECVEKHLLSSFAEKRVSSEKAMKHMLYIFHKDSVKKEESRIFRSLFDSLVANDKWQTALITLFRRVPLRKAFSIVAPHIILQQQ